MTPTPNAVWKALRSIKWRLDPVLDRWGYKLEKKGQSGPSFFTELLNDRLEAPGEIVFVQIGANDGVSTDPIHPLIRKFPRRFRGLVVEPLKDKFDLLVRAYADVESVRPVNVAVHNTEKEMLIHRVRPDLERKLPAWARGIGSFNPDHHKLSHLDSSVMVAESVTCTTFDDLLATHQISNVEVLITDTEGYDYEILRSIDFGRHRPTYVHFEHGLSSGTMAWQEYKQLARHLSNHGYSISHEASDATAFLPAALDDAAPR